MEIGHIELNPHIHWDHGKKKNPKTHLNSNIRTQKSKMGFGVFFYHDPNVRGSICPGHGKPPGSIIMISQSKTENIS
jgi:hypothetical protein